MQFLAYSQISNMKIYQSIQIWPQKYPRVEKGKERVKKDKSIHFKFPNFLYTHMHYKIYYFNHIYVI